MRNWRGRVRQFEGLAQQNRKVKGLVRQLGVRASQFEGLARPGEAV